MYYFEFKIFIEINKDDYIVFYIKVFQFYFILGILGCYDNKYSFIFNSLKILEKGFLRMNINGKL